MKVGRLCARARNEDWDEGWYIGQDVVRLRLRVSDLGGWRARVGVGSGWLKSLQGPGSHGFAFRLDLANHEH